MDNSNYSLVLGSSASFLISLLHIALTIHPKLYRYFNAAELAEIHEKGSPFTVLVTLGLVLMFILWGVYGLSGAGLLQPLPLLKASLIAIGVIYMLRGLMLPSEIIRVIQSGYPIRFIGFSLVSLTVGLLYIHGVIVQL